MKPAEKSKDQLVLELQILTRKHEELKQLYLLDLSERLKAEAALKKSGNNDKKEGNALHETNKKMEAILSASADGIGIVSLDGRMELMSEKLATMYGYQIGERDENIGKPVFGFIDPSNHKDLTDNIKKLFSGEKGHNVTEYIAIKKDNSKFNIEVNSSLLSDSEGKPSGIMFIVRDITKRKQAEETLQKSEAELRELNATKDKFFSIIAHDLKSPFQSIMGFSELLVEYVRNKDYDEAEEFAGYVLQSSKRAMELLANLMEWSRSQTGRMDFNPEHFEMEQFLGDLVPLFDNVAGQKSIRIIRELPNHIVTFADKAMISTVFRNLISNAIKFTQPGGGITLTIVPDQNGLLVSVRDTGIGIPEKMIGRLFRIDQSYSTIGTNNEEGTGLGLILCKEFVEKHGGKIWAESEVGQGSVFYFTLPDKRNP